MKLPSLGATLREALEAIHLLARGRGNASGTVTLTAGATSTTVKDAVVGAGMKVFLQPATLNAAGALVTTYVPAATITAGQFVVSHANAASTDRTFFWHAYG